MAGTPGPARNDKYPPAGLEVSEMRSRNLSLERARYSPRSVSISASGPSADSSTRTYSS